MGYTFFANPVAALTLAGQVASSPATSLDLSAYIPIGTKAVITQIGITMGVAVSSVDQIEIHKEAGVAPGQVIVTQPGTGLGTSFNQGICPVKSDRTIEYTTTVNAGNTATFLVFLIGYIT
jgi:hypothetical protein